MVLEFISQGIDAANAEVPSDSAKIIKWTILRTDFSVVGGELGEQAGAHPPAPGVLVKAPPFPGPGSPRHLRFSPAPPRTLAGGEGGGPPRRSSCRMAILRALWVGPIVPLLPGPLNPSRPLFRPQPPPCTLRTDLAR